MCKLPYSNNKREVEFLGRAKSKHIKDLERKINYEHRRFKMFEERMAEKDTARSIVRSLSIHDAETGDVVFTEDNLSEIQTALLAGKYYIEIDRGAGFAPKRVWFDIDVDVGEQAVSQLEVGQVLNCSINPCWWR
jgi:hypothetical protein